MRLSIKGAILLKLGMATVGAMLLITMTYDNVLLIGLTSFGHFIGWLLIVSGVEALWQVYRDIPYQKRLKAKGGPT